MIIDAKGIDFFVSAILFLRKRPGKRIDFSRTQNENLTQAQSRAHAPARRCNYSLGQDDEESFVGGIVGAFGSINGVYAEDTLPPMGKTFCDPYKNYSCLDSYLGDDYITRFVNYYRLEWGHDSAPSDPKAPPGRRDYWPTTPQSTPPMPFAEWPYGGTTNLGVTRPSSIDSPLMAALGNTTLGQEMNENHIQIYGWINAGDNLSNNTVRGGNAPAAYDYNPNTVQLDQAVIYFERLPDTVQKDHVDWGFRIAPIYGENYRYTTAFGLSRRKICRSTRRSWRSAPTRAYFPVRRNRDHSCCT